MKNTNIQKIRNLLNERIAIAKVSADNENYLIMFSIKDAESILALLPCKTCGGTGKSLEYAKACPECGCAEYVNENLLGENYRECKNCGQDWWLQVKYGIGDDPCPDCQ